MHTMRFMVARHDTIFPTVSVLGLPVAAVRADAFLEWLLESAAKRPRAATIGYLNAAQANLAFEDAAHARRLRGLDVVYADGQSIVWAARGGLPERVNAGDFTRLLMERLAARGLTLALLGGRPGEAEKAGEKFKSWAPGLKIVFSHHGFFSDAGAANVREMLEGANPDLVLVAMGAPRQERWALEWAGAGKPRVWWCVGALLEYYAGTRRRAPVWMRRAGLEWLARLALEPARLWRRYLIGNPLFVWRVWRGTEPPEG